MRLTVHVIFYTVALFCITGVWLFSIMYLREIRKAKQHIHLESPALLGNMLKTNMAVCLGLTIIIILSLLYELVAW